MGTIGSKHMGRQRATFNTTIASDLHASRDVQKHIIEQVTRARFNSQSAFAIKLALEEALNNAIRHGNQLDAKKKVHVVATITSESAEIVIEDEGVGFRRSDVPDPTLDENLHRCSGRGILLIESYMDEVKWSRGGRRLRMVKRNKPDV